MTKPPQAPGTPGADALKERESQEMTLLLGQLPGDAASVTLKRRSDQDPLKWDALGRVGASEFSIDLVRDYYGGGDYRAQVVNAQGRFILQPMEFSIDPRFKPTRGPLAEAAAAAAPASPPSELRELIDLLKRGPSAPAADPFDQLLKLSTVMKNLQPAAPAAAGHEGVSLIVEAMKLVDQLRGGGPIADTERTDPLAAAIVGARPLVEAIAGKLRLDTDLARQRALAPGAPLPPAPTAAPAALAASTAAAPAPAPAPTAAPTWVDRVRPYLVQIVAAAQAGQNPEAVADQVLGMLPTSWYDAIAEDAVQPAFIERTLLVAPELRAVEPWARQFLGIIEAQLTEPAPDAAPAPSGTP